MADGQFVGRHGIDPELIEAIRAVVAEAVRGEEERRGLPTHEALVGEWRLRLTLPSGAAHLVSCPTESDALAAGRRIDADGSGSATWRIEHRLVGMWAVVRFPAPLPAGNDAEAEHEGRDLAP